MGRRIIGTIMLLIGGLGIIVLLTYGGPIVPHIIGPSILAVLGLVLLILKRKP